MNELSLINCRLDRRYDIHSLLGRGSYAEIFIAEDTLSSHQSPHRLVAIKALNVFLQDDLDADLERTLVENFQNEAFALDRVRHPNIISRFGHGTARDLQGTVFHYLVLEYLAGGDLQSLVRKQKLDRREAIRYIEQICAGLRHAHSQGIIHRDIKPQNLLLSSDLSTVKIADFGVARNLVSDSPITHVGTNLYAPPEHSPLSAGKLGNFAPGQILPASDIYSLAKAIYTLLTGEPPRSFSNEPISSLPQTIEDEEWAGELLRVLNRATDANPSARHQSIDELWDDLLTVRERILDAEVSTLVRSRVAEPQPHVVRGYTPYPPPRPSFSEITDVGSRLPPITRESAPVDGRYLVTPPSKGQFPAAIRPGTSMSEAKTEISESTVPAKPRFKRRLLRGSATIAITLILLAGVIYGVSNIMQSFGLLPQIQNPFRQKVGVANTDIYLRPTPNTKNEPIGLVTRNSRVRILNSRNNWYQVDILEQGRVRPQAASSQRGWLNGKYLTFEQN